MHSLRRLICICAFIIIINITILIGFIKWRKGEHCFITINEQSVKLFLPNEFLSVGIDASEIQRNTDFADQRFRDLAAALSPARVRFGGTMSDRLIFSFNSCLDSDNECNQKFLPYFLMTGDRWTEINEFCKATNLKLLFTLNVLLRNEHGWDEVNAKDLIAYSKFKNFDIDWQLGNEPNSFLHTFNITITPKQLAYDFRKLRSILNKFGYKNKKPLIVGPDTTRPQPNRPECLQYMMDFLGNGSKYINVRSWHQYYLNSRTAKLADFWNPDTFDLLENQIDTMKIHTKQFEHIPMWLTETSSSYGGGTPGLSNSYAGTPLWLDKLGLCARYNITTVIRQSLFGGNYSLIDENLNPLPDWWVSVLYKKLVGNKVLNVFCNCSRHQRMYAHCTNKKYNNDSSAVTLYGINMQLKKINFVLNGTALHGPNLLIDEFIIRAPSNERKSKVVLLNNWPLYYVSKLPVLEPRQLKYGNKISMPPYSVGFWVIRNTSMMTCK